MDTATRKGWQKVIADLRTQVVRLEAELQQAQEWEKYWWTVSNGLYAAFMSTQAERDAAIERGKRLWYFGEAWIEEAYALLHKLEAAERDAEEKGALARWRRKAALKLLLLVGRGGHTGQWCSSHYSCEEPRKVRRELWRACGATPAEAQEQSGQEEGDPPNPPDPTDPNP